MSHVPTLSPRTVHAPPPSPASMKPLPNRVFSVVLQSDEDVEWTWMHTTDGVSYVTGYTIIQRER
jgi:hypothetical protein